MEEIVELNVGGTHFTTTRSTLSKEPDSMLARMFAGVMTPSTKDSSGRYFINRCGVHFSVVLAYLRGECLILNSASPERLALLQEAKYYQVASPTRYGQLCFSLAPPVFASWLKHMHVKRSTPAHFHCVLLCLYALCLSNCFPFQQAMWPCI